MTPLLKQDLLAYLLESARSLGSHDETLLCAALNEDEMYYLAGLIENDIVPQEAVREA